MFKKLLAVLLAAILACSLIPCAFAAGETPGFGDYKRVFIIGVDGGGAAWEIADTPNCDRIFADNALRYDCTAEYVTVSAQNWGSILCGVAYDVHGFTNGSIEENERSSDAENNSVFRYVREAYPNAELASFCNWEPINHGIIENDLGVKKIHRGTDPLVTQQIVSYLNAGNKPTLMFVQLDSVDHAGHTFGGFSKQYYNALTKADGYVGEIYDALDKNGLLEDGLFILVSDHGETTDGHGGTTPEESSVIVAAAGKTVNKVTIPAGTRNRDVAAITLHALGIETPAHMTAAVPEGMFGAAREKTVAPLPINAFEKFFRDFGNIFVRGVNLLLSIFD